MIAWRSRYVCKMLIGRTCGMILTEETEILGENPVLLSVCPQFPQGPNCDRNRDLGERGPYD
jgi:hypothetical protein